MMASETIIYSITIRRISIVLRIQGNKDLRCINNFTKQNFRIIFTRTRFGYIINTFRKIMKVPRQL